MPASPCSSCSCDPVDVPGVPPFDVAVEPDVPDLPDEPATVAIVRVAKRVLVSDTAEMVAFNVHDPPVDMSLPMSVHVEPSAKKGKQGRRFSKFAMPDFCVRCEDHFLGNVPHPPCQRATCVGPSWSTRALMGTALDYDWRSGARKPSGS